MVISFLIPWSGELWPCLTGALKEHLDESNAGIGGRVPREVNKAEREDGNTDRENADLGRRR